MIGLRVRRFCTTAGRKPRYDKSRPQKQTHKLSDLERTAIWRNRWAKEDPGVADRPSSVFEDELGTEPWPKGLSFGYIQNKLKWDIFDEHEKNPGTHTITALSNKHKISKERISAILLQKRLIKEDEAKGLTYQEDSEDDIMHVQRETAEEYSQHYGTTFDTAFVEREYAVPEFSTKVLYEDDNERDIDLHQPKKLKEEYIQREERKLGKARMERIEQYHSGKAQLENSVLSRAPSDGPQRRFSFVMRDTSLPFSPSIMRSKDGSLRFSSPIEDTKRSWRNEILLPGEIE